ncbi:MAG TPA: HXXEE domain-containing protein, partial [Mycobacterium sp.]|nr:HXXEE domain-containing protein [Mycobacterium sp.]
MRILLKVWLPIMAVLAVVALGYLIVNWSAMTTTHRLSFIGLIVIVAHIHEEERFPGGFGYMFNVLINKSDLPDRYPMSPLIAMLVDVSAFFVLFVPAVFFPELIWLGAAPMFLLIMEFLMHGSIGVFIQWRRRGLSIYNPGLATACVMGAVGISYIVVVSNELMSGRDWLFAALYYVAAMIVCLGIPEYGLRSRTTRWAFGRDRYLGYYKRYTT